VSASHRRADLIAGASGLVLLIVIFLIPWFGASAAADEALREAQEVTQQFGGGNVKELDLDQTAWEAFELIRFVLLAAALAGIVSGAAMLAQPGRHSTSGPAAVTAGLGMLATLLVLYRVIDPPGDASREIGLFVGFFASLGVAVGGWLGLDASAPSGDGARRDPIGSPSDG
jgi:hypothetical protein